MRVGCAYACEVRSCGRPLAGAGRAACSALAAAPKVRRVRRTELGSARRAPRHGGGRARIVADIRRRRGRRLTSVAVVLGEDGTTCRTDEVHPTCGFAAFIERFALDPARARFSGHVGRSAARRSARMSLAARARTSTTSAACSRRVTKLDASPAQFPCTCDARSPPWSGHLTAPPSSGGVLRRARANGRRARRRSECASELRVASSRGSHPGSVEPKFVLAEPSRMLGHRRLVGSRLRCGVHARRHRLDHPVVPPRARRDGLGGRPTHRRGSGPGSACPLA